MIAAIFDLDGTLYTGHIVRGIARHHRAHRVKRLPLYFYMATHVALWPLWRSGLLSEATMRELWARHLGWTVRGWTLQEAAAAFAWVAEQYVQPLVRPDAMARLRDHQAAGHRIIIVSGTLAPLLAESSDSVLWPQNYAYADSFTDLPLLERVGHPVAVYPDSQLTAHARSQGWEIMA